MHQGKHVFDVDLSVNDVTTPVQHVTCCTWLGWRNARAFMATHRLLFWVWRSFKRRCISCESLSRTNICHETVHVIGGFWVSRRNGESTTSTRDAKGCQLVGSTPTPSLAQHLMYNRTIRKARHRDQDQILRRSKYCVWCGQSARGLDRYVTPLSEGNTNSTRMSTSLLAVLQKIGHRATGSDARVWVFPECKHFRRTLHTQWINLCCSWKCILILYWKPEVALWDDKNNRMQIVKAVPSKPGVTHISAENQQWPTNLAGWDSDMQKNWSPHFGAVQGVAVDLIFFDFYLGVFLGSFLNYAFFLNFADFFDFRKISKIVRVLTSNEFNGLKTHKTDVTNGKTSHPVTSSFMTS